MQVSACLSTTGARGTARIGAADRGRGPGADSAPSAPPRLGTAGARCGVVAVGSRRPVRWDGVFSVSPGFRAHALPLSVQQADRDRLRLADVGGESVGGDFLEHPERCERGGRSAGEPHDQAVGVLRVGHID